VVQAEFEDAKVVIRIRVYFIDFSNTSKKDMYYNNQKNKVKWTNNDIQNTTQKTKIANLLYDLYIDIPFLDNVYFRRVCL
jgi:hypothetical protein